MADKPLVTSARERERDGWDNPERGTVSWYTLVSGDITPTSALSCGIAEFEPRKGILKPHRHDPAELYHILEGQGILTLEGQERTVTAGDTVFIPGNAEHGIRNEGDAVLRLFYVFPQDRFSDVVYRFPDAG
ncbi:MULTISPECIES: cupin domain-containing protein [Mesorhizobium]|uniref:Cupin domain-containing protein n=1 Tax=Mesorhizobium denitrificans TaxID=2294114 RepID=A0A371XE69_9HYPH|nr:MULTISPECIES: cupin domain-containing protein [Mesorhizobium]RFC67530.1 cupin domain-containing protein [Mesorhizobium denitrificans]